MNDIDAIFNPVGMKPYLSLLYSSLNSPTNVMGQIFDQAFPMGLVDAVFCRPQQKSLDSWYTTKLTNRTYQVYQRITVPGSASIIRIAVSRQRISAPFQIWGSKFNVNISIENPSLHELPKYLKVANFMVLHIANDIIPLDQLFQHEIPRMFDTYGGDHLREWTRYSECLVNLREKLSGYSV
jgi:hypothetical protein